MAYELKNPHPRKIICTLAGGLSAITVDPGELLPSPAQEKAGLTVEALKDFIKPNLLKPTKASERLEACAEAKTFRAEEPVAAAPKPIIPEEIYAEAAKPKAKQDEAAEKITGEAVLEKPVEKLDLLALIKDLKQVRAIAVKEDRKMTINEAAIELQKIADAKCSSKLKNIKRTEDY